MTIKFHLKKSYPSSDPKYLNHLLGHVMLYGR